MNNSLLRSGIAGSILSQFQLLKISKLKKKEDICNLFICSMSGQFLTLLFLRQRLFPCILYVDEVFRRSSKTVYMPKYYSPTARSRIHK